MIGDQITGGSTPRAETIDTKGDNAKGGIDFKDLKVVEEKTTKLQQSAKELEAAQKSLLEEKVGRHESLAYRLPRLRRLLQVAEEVLNSSATLEIMGGLHDANPNISRLKAKVEEARDIKQSCQHQITVEEEEIKNLFEHPDVSEYIIGEGFTDLGVEKKSAQRREGIKSLTDINDNLIKKMQELVQESDSPGFSEKQEEFTREFEEHMVKARKLDEETVLPSQYGYLNRPYEGRYGDSSIAEAVHKDFIDRAMKDGLTENKVLQPLFRRMREILANQESSI